MGFRQKADDVRKITGPFPQPRAAHSVLSHCSLFAWYPLDVLLPIEFVPWELERTAALCQHS